jgi:hypothetical protein
MLSLCRAILPVCMWTGDVMGDPNTLEEGIEFLVLATPIGLYVENFSIKQSPN